MRYRILILILAVLTISCSKTTEESFAFASIEEDNIPMTRQEMLNPPTPPLPPLTSEKIIKKKIIKDGRLGIEVADLEASKIRIDSLTKTHGGYYANENFSNNDWELSYDLKIRIPSKNFEIFVAQIEFGKDKILYKSINARDVTDDFIDLETRLLNKKDYLKRYRELLLKAKNVKEIIEIEEKIRGLEEEIESTTGRLEYLSDQVNYSTLDISISKRRDFKYDPEKRDNFSESLKKSLSKGWFGFIDFVLFVIKIWPFWIIVSVIIILLRKLRRKKKNK